LPTCSRTMSRMSTAYECWALWLLHPIAPKTAMPRNNGSRITQWHISIYFPADDVFNHSMFTLSLSYGSEDIFISGSTNFLYWWILRSSSYHGQPTNNKYQCHSQYTITTIDYLPSANLMRIKIYQINHVYASHYYYDLHTVQISLYSNKFS
jgi:hypothetical protein